MSRIGLVLVAHSAKLAAGVAELAAQMAPDVVVVPAGGLADGTLGTDYDATVAAVRQADSGSGVVVLYDLGSAQMTAELAVESLADPEAAMVVDAPLVEGAIAAAVSAQGGNPRGAVAEAAIAAGAPAERAGQGATEYGTTEQGTPEPESVDGEFILHNEIGLHARPAALLARSVQGLDATVRVRFGDTEADATSVLGLMSLGARHGDRIEVRASGRQAGEALAGIDDLVTRNFAE